MGAECDCITEGRKKCIIGNIYGRKTTMLEIEKTTMGHITKEHLQQSRISIPPIELIQKLDQKISIFLNKQVILEQENQQLAELRDWLLPMLMNGQARVA